MRTKLKKRLIRVVLSLVSVFLILSAVPYLIPTTIAASERRAPFPESIFTELDGTLLHYRPWAARDADIKGKVLLVHGLGGSTFSWRNNTDALTEAGYLVLAVDLPGFGYSDRKRGLDHSQENRSLLLWQLLDQVDETLGTEMKEASWNLVGHSMGGGTVTAMALANPARTCSIVLADGAVLAGGPSSLGSLLAYPPAGRWFEVLFRNVFLKREKLADFLASAYGSTPSEADVEGYYQPLLTDGTEGSFVDMMRTSTSISKRSLQELVVPVTAIWGSLDTWVPLAEADKLKAILPSMSLDVIPGAGHCAMETHSAEFNRYLVAALDRATE